MRDSNYSNPYFIFRVSRITFTNRYYPTLSHPEIKKKNVIVEPRKDWASYLSEWGSPRKAQVGTNTSNVYYLLAMDRNRCENSIN